MSSRSLGVSTVPYHNKALIHPIVQHNMHSSSIMSGQGRARSISHPANPQINGNEIHQGDKLLCFELV